MCRKRGITLRGEGGHPPFFLQEDEQCQEVPKVMNGGGELPSEREPTGKLEGWIGEMEEVTLEPRP